jgi:hypothetical protein
MTSVADARHAGGRLGVRDLLARISPLEWVIACVVAIVLLVLVVLDPDILEAPFASTRAAVVFFGGTLLAAIVGVVMLRLGVPPVIRVLVLGVPFVIVSWWLISPFFIDDVVDEKGPSIAAAQRNAASATAPTEAPGATPPAAVSNTPPTTTLPPAPVLRGAGQFVGLAGHSGTGDAGIVRLEDGSQVLRLENFDIDNGPDLKLYLVPGADRRAPDDGSYYFGDLRGNVGNQTYAIPNGYDVAPGEWTVLVWCKAFTVEFVAATLTVT